MNKSITMEQLDGLRLDSLTEEELTAVMEQLTNLYNSMLEGEPEDAESREYWELSERMADLEDLLDEAQDLLDER